MQASVGIVARERYTAHLHVVGERTHWQQKNCQADGYKSFHGCWFILSFVKNVEELIERIEAIALFFACWNRP